MRQVVLDTETTGLEPNMGHRVIEVGAVEMVNRKLTRGIFPCFFSKYEKHFSSSLWLCLYHLNQKELEDWKAKDLPEALP